MYDPNTDLYTVRPQNVQDVLHLGCLHSWAQLSCFLSATVRISDTLKILSKRLSEGVFATKFCSYLLGRLGYEWLQSVRVAECMDLLSTFCRHAGLAFKAVADLVAKVIEYRGANCAPKVVNSISEANDIIAQWKRGSPRFAIDVPTNMTTEMAMILNEHFEDQGFGHLFQGARIKSSSSETADALEEKASPKVEV